MVASELYITYKVSRGGTRHTASALGTTAKELLTMTTKPLPSISELRQRLRYDPVAGKLYWRECDSNSRCWNSRWAGKEAGSRARGDGYSKVNVAFHQMKAHRVAWALYHGSWPDGEIDHINHQRTDNRIKNLRDVTPLENRRNQRMKFNNTSGTTGVVWCKQTSLWKAQICFAGKGLHLGRFVRIKDAIEARKSAEERYGFHANHGT